MNEHEQGCPCGDPHCHEEAVPERCRLRRLTQVDVVTVTEGEADVPLETYWHDLGGEG